MKININSLFTCLNLNRHRPVQDWIEFQLKMTKGVEVAQWWRSTFKKPNKLSVKSYFFLLAQRRAMLHFSFETCTSLVIHIFTNFKNFQMANVSYFRGVSNTARDAAWTNAFQLEWIPNGSCPTKKRESDSKTFSRKKMNKQLLKVQQERLQCHLAQNERGEN